MHLIRTTTQTNLALSQMADNKASMLMGATFVVFTIAVGQASKGNMPASLLCLAFFAFSSAICAVLAVLPSTGGPLPPVEQRNVLFFGIFAQYDENEFIDSMFHAVSSDEQVLRTMLRDIYQNGVVMKRKKYRFLRLAYMNFLIGLTLTFLVFLVERGQAVFHFGT